MGTPLVHTPKASAWVITGDGTTSGKTLSPIMQADTVNTIAPAISPGVVIVSDPDGMWKNLIHPNDLLYVGYNSVRNPNIAPALASADWQGLVDDVSTMDDPGGNGWGRCTIIKASSNWKLLNQTAVPLYHFTNGDFPRGGMQNSQLIGIALNDVYASTGVRIQLNSALAINGQIPAWSYPQNQFLDPTLQSWASYILAQVTLGGNELFFREDGTLVFQQTQFQKGTIDFLQPDDEVFNKVYGLSDDGLVTNVAVKFSMVQSTQQGLAGLSPPPSSGPQYPWAPDNIGQLPDDLNLPNGKPLPRIGQRAQVLYVPWLQNLDAAMRYAQMVRTIGMAQVNHAQVVSVLNGDVRLASIYGLNQVNGSKVYRYYVTSIQHHYLFGQDARTTLTLRYGIDNSKQWAVSSLAAPGTLSPLSASPSTPGTDDTSTMGQTSQTCADLPKLADDPNVKITNPTISVYTIQTILSQAGSPMAPLASYIMQDAIKYNIDPSFALAVFQQEDSFLTNPNGNDIAHNNPGSIGPQNAYPTIQAGIDAFFQTIQSYMNNGLLTISQIGTRYDPGDALWVTNVTAFMNRIRSVECQSETFISGSMPVTPGDGTSPQGYPFGTQLGYVTQVFANTAPPYGELEPAGTYNGVPYKHIHRGIDIILFDSQGNARANIPCYATMNGTLTAQEDYTGYGFLVTIQNGVWWVKYAHCNGLASGVSSGQVVKAGQLICLSGGDPATAPTFPDGSSYAGNSTGYHLHYEIDQGNLNNFVDPNPTF